MPSNGQKIGALVRLPIFAGLWALFLAIKVPTIATGWVMVAALARYRDRDYADLPWWTRPWSNLEDWRGQVNHYQGCLPRWWVLEHGVGFWSFYRYHALRNGADGLRSFEWLDLDVDPARVRYWTPEFFVRYEPAQARAAHKRTIGYIAWQGLRAGTKVVRIWSDERHLVIKLGWRVEPNDAHDPYGPPELHQNEGFSTKFLAYRRG